MTTRLLLLLLITNVCFSQDYEKDHQALAGKVNEINRYPDHQQVKIASEDIADVFQGQAWLTGFYKGDMVRKITLVVETEVNVTASNYYFENGNVIYVTEVIDKFTSTDKMKTTRVYNGKYYFKDNKLFDHESTGSGRFDDASVDIEARLLSEAKKNADLMNRMKSGATGSRN